MRYKLTLTFDGWDAFTDATDFLNEAGELVGDHVHRLVVRVPDVYHIDLSRCEEAEGPEATP